MEFKSLNNIETSFRQIRLYAFVFAIWKSHTNLTHPVKVF